MTQAWISPAPLGFREMDLPDVLRAKSSRAAAPEGVDVAARRVIVTALLDGRVVVELDVDDPASENWVARPYGAFDDQLLGFSPGNVRVRITGGRLDGMESNAVVVVNGGHPMLLGSEPFFEEPEAP
ncbi:MAG: hypothetical protein JWL73_3413 [Actinomycetia bacterium]|nr:hypothetical protein [Actinomycetes bacterium]